MKNKPFIHPNTPRKLAAAYHFARNKRGEGFKIHVLAERIGVNVRYIQDLIKNGIEPTNPEIRAKMFLSKKSRQVRAAEKSDATAKPMPEYVKYWRRQKPFIRQAWMIRAYNAGKEKPNDQAK